tara:strand:- start:4203 stop:4937 length:735 start_codon:yes stop_codon:yes gene_type:complete
MRLILIGVTFFLGILYCMHSTHELREGFNTKTDCPNLLVQKGKELHLTYTNKAKIPGVNPVKFDNLEDYTEFVNWQRAKGIRCPVLYFKQTYDTQNNLGYKMTPTISIKQDGVQNTINTPKEQQLYDANHDDKPYNNNSYAGFDSDDQYVGAYTPLDKKFKSTEKVSANAMDVQWGGATYSEEMVEGGVFKENSRSMNENPFDNKDTKPTTTQSKINETPVLKREIATRYGGQSENHPIMRTLR